MEALKASLAAKGAAATARNAAARAASVLRQKATGTEG